VPIPNNLWGVPKDVKSYTYHVASAALLARRPEVVRLTNRASGGMLIAAEAVLARTSEEPYPERR
jgi:acetyl esterase/lipase